MDLKEELISDTLDDVIGEADEDEETLVHTYNMATQLIYSFS